MLLPVLDPTVVSALGAKLGSAKRDLLLRVELVSVRRDLLEISVVQPISLGLRRLADRMTAVGGRRAYAALLGASAIDDLGDGELVVEALRVAAAEVDALALASGAEPAAGAGGWDGMIAAVSARPGGARAAALSGPGTALLREHWADFGEALFATAVDQIGADVASLRAAAPEQRARLFHGLRGAALHVGLERFERVCTAGEQMAKLEQDAIVDRLVDRHLDPTRDLDALAALASELRG
ncbi:MAG TPA: hypothetical protein PKA64_14870, partial [Myxococcota bacterium]|nr:hypothetical protein [Myxococcota bacterium]